jgi:hypothetical protein
MESALDALSSHFTLVELLHRDMHALIARFDQRVRDLADAWHASVSDGLNLAGQPEATPEVAELFSGV